MIDQWEELYRAWVRHGVRSPDFAEALIDAFNVMIDPERRASILKQEWGPHDE